MNHLVLKGGIYHVKIDVPEYARSHPEIAGRKVLSKTLKTGDRSLAKSRAHFWLADWKAWFSEMKSTDQNTNWHGERQKTEVQESDSQENEDSVVGDDLSHFSSPMLGVSLFNKDYVGLLLNGKEGRFRPVGEELYLTRNMFSNAIAHQFKMYLGLQTENLKTINQKFSRWLIIGQYFKEKNEKLNFSTVAAFLRQLQAAASTKKGYIAAGSCFWSCLCELEPDYFEHHKNPFHGQRITTVSNVIAGYDAPKRQAFSKEQVIDLLERAFIGELFDIHDVLMIGAYTGMRLEEIFSITRSDLQDNFIIVRGAKTVAGGRKVPVHSGLKSLILKLLEQAQGKDGYLVHSSSKNTYGIRSDPFSKKFSRFLRANEYGKEYVFHSIRKTVATTLQQADVPELITANILGHKIGTMSYGLYSAGASDEQMLRAIEVISY